MIESYLFEEDGFECLAKKYSVSYTSLRNWVHGYKKMDRMRCFASVKTKNILLNISFMW